MTDVQPVLVPRRSPVQARSGPPAKRYMANTNGSPKVKHAINLMIWGADDGLPMRRQDAAKAAGLADVTLRQALANPMVMKFYREQLDVLRTGERPRSIAKIAALRDTAGSERVQLEAAKYLDTGDQQRGVVVNVGVGVNVQPGYAVTIPSDMADAGRQMLKLAGSHANVMDMQADVPTPSDGTPE